jgi:hypothetical protein
MAKTVLLATHDLFFRAKLQAVVQAAGAAITRAEPCDLAVVELRAGRIEMIRRLVEQGVAVLAFGSHVEPGMLREAKALGARAVPNSEVESALRALLSA